KKLGANVYIDSQATNAAQELQKLGGARVILATAPSSKAMSALIDGLGPNGKLVVVGAAPDPIEVTPSQLIFGSKTIQGWAAGTPAASEDTLNFCVLTGVRPGPNTRNPTAQLGKRGERYLCLKDSFRSFNGLIRSGKAVNCLVGDPWKQRRRFSITT